MTKGGKWADVEIRCPLLHNGWFWKISSKNCLTMDFAQNRLSRFKNDLKSHLHLYKGQKGQHISFLSFKGQTYAKMIFYFLFWTFWYRSDLFYLKRSFLDIQRP